MNESAHLGWELEQLSKNHDGPASESTVLIGRYRVSSLNRLTSLTSLLPRSQVSGPRAQRGRLQPGSEAGEGEPGAAGLRRETEGGEPAPAGAAAAHAGAGPGEPEPEQQGEQELDWQVEDSRRSSPAEVRNQEQRIRRTGILQILRWILRFGIRSQTPDWFPQEKQQRPRPGRGLGFHTESLHCGENLQQFRWIKSL